MLRLWPCAGTTARPPLGWAATSVRRRLLTQAEPSCHRRRLGRDRRGFRNAPQLAERTTTTTATSSSSSSSPGKPLATRDHAFSSFAFAFDIDGVLYRGGQAIPGAREMLRSIRRKDIRYVFLTNGGGTHETAKADSLAKRLGLSPDEEDVVRDRVILSHTPMRGWADEVKQQTVLVTGSHPETARRIANEYGFSRAVTPADLIHANDKLYPFDNLKETLHSEFQPLPDGKSAAGAPADPYSRDLVAADALLKIDKILVWNDPRDWSLDIQVIHDLLVSRGGHLGTVSDRNGDRSLPNNGWQQDGQPELWISNLDLVWKTEFPVNRFGTGAFVAALQGVWAAVTDGGAELQYQALGKPSRFTYEYAHARLVREHAAGSTSASTSGSESRGKNTTAPPPIKRVYMIGDNPESDIRGANEFRPEDGTEWVSVLVRTGVWRQTAAEKGPRYKPAVIVDDVVDAIVWALRNEGVDGASREWLLEGGQ